MKTKIKTYEDMIVWKKADELALIMFTLVNKYPKNEIKEDQIGCK